MKEINIERMVSRIEQISRCSETFPGVTRLSFTPQSEKAEEMVIGWMQEAGLAVRKDGMNNIIGRFQGRNNHAPVLLMGSHIDSVVNGGKYDGTLGVIAAIEVIQVLHDKKMIPEHPIEVVCFCDEEGTRFHTTFLGSRAMTGTLTVDDLGKLDDNGISVSEAMRSIGLIPEYFYLVQRDKDAIHAYLELHIEQGPILEKLNEPCGVVMGIAGVSRYSFTITGVSGHAGTVPMSNRQDALAGAAEILLSIEEYAKQYDSLVATVGKLMVSPGASNVIPDCVKGTLDVRDSDQIRKTAFLKELNDHVNEICARRNLACQLERVMEIEPVSCSKQVMDCIETSMIKNGLIPYRLMSGAGHDAMVMSTLTDIGMIFVRCKEGLSHCPEEFVSTNDIEISTKVLLDAAWKLANK